jgi:hypothetical protein
VRTGPAALLLAAFATAATVASAQPTTPDLVRKPGLDPGGTTEAQRPAPAATTAPRPRIRFLLANDSGQIIESLQTMAAGGAGPWSEKLLGTLRLPSGNGVQVNHPDRGTCHYDLRVAYADGRSEIRRGQDLCTLRMLRFEPGGGATAR